MYKCLESELLDSTLHTYLTIYFCTLHMILLTNVLISCVYLISPVFCVCVFVCLCVCTCVTVCNMHSTLYFCKMHVAYVKFETWGIRVLVQQLTSLQTIDEQGILSRPTVIPKIIFRA